MKKSRRIVKKMSKKSLINKKALRYIIANSNLCKHAIRELELAGYSKEEDGPNKWMREQVIEAVALFSSHGNSGFSAPFEINLVKKLCSFDIISPLRFDDGEWEKIGLDGSCQNKRKSSIFKEPDGSIHDVDAFSKVPVKKFGNYIPVYTSLPITITNNHKLYKYYICWVKSSLGIWIEKPGGCSSRWESPFMFTLARCRSSVSFNDGYTTIALCTWVRMHRYDLFPLFCFSHNF